MDWETFVRIANLIGSVFALWLLASTRYRQWNTWNYRTRVHWMALVGWVFLGFEATLESLIFNTDPGPRTILTSLVIAWTVRALLIEQPLESNANLPWKDTNK